MTKLVTFITIALFAVGASTSAFAYHKRDHGYSGGYVYSPYDRRGNLSDSVQDSYGAPSQ